jgi:hypothetical protein
LDICFNWSPARNSARFALRHPGFQIGRPLSGGKPFPQDNPHPFLRRPKGNLRVGQSCFQVYGGNLVSILFVPTVEALKSIPVAVLPVNEPTTRAHLRGIRRVDLQYRTANHVLKNPAEMI